MKTIQDPTRWSPGAQSRYIAQAREMYQSKAGNPYVMQHWRWALLRDKAYYVEPPKVRESLISKLYEEGRLHGLLKIDFQEFRAILLELWRSKTRIRVGHGRYSRHTGLAEWKHSSKFRQPSHTGKIGKKVSKDQAWRKELGLQRDRRKSMWRRGNHKQAAKKESARTRRAYERQLVQKGDWDSVPTEIRRDFIDPWMYS